jgi:hypothetical protein
MPLTVSIRPTPTSIRRTSFGEGGKIPVVDELDAAIIQHLKTDARQTNRELAAAVGIAPSTCLERVRSLRERGVITGYHAEISLPALNRSVQALASEAFPADLQRPHRFRPAVSHSPGVRARAAHPAGSRAPPAAMTSRF